MSKSDTLENSFLLLLFNATTFANVAINATSSPLTNLYVSLHTGTLTDSSSQTTNEATYTGYARKDVVRTSSGWTVSANQASNAAAVTFAPCTGGSNTITYVAIGTDSTGTGRVLYWGALSASLAVSAGITPEFGAGVLIASED